jgi:CheY-like chemotaxis protein/HPt (histidine-containing phosphotransfer) domain-containing protein
MKPSDFQMIRSKGALPDPAHAEIHSVIEELWDPYVDSVTTLLSQLEEAAMELESGKNSRENCSKIRRILHSIKGDSGMTGLMDVYSLCHEAESAFEEIPDMSGRADMVLRVKDWIETVIEIVRRGGNGKSGSFEKSQPRKIKTLVIDDDQVCRQRVSMIVQDFCECTFANDGKRGFELFKKAFEEGQPFQFVTLDIQMPDMDGHETLSAIRLLEQQHGVEGLDGAKIVMITSQHHSSHIFSAFREGCEAYVIKTNLGEKLPEEMANLGLLTMKPNYSIR